jgi:hypothetical protein
MPGCGGLRKIRWPGRGKGKSGGLRIIYLNVPEQSRIYLIDVYAKGEQENISPEDKRDYRRLVLAIRKSPR